VILRFDPCGRSALIAAAGLIATATAAEAQSGGPWTDDWYYRQPPISLPQQLNGVLRPSHREDMRAVRIDNVRQVFAAVRSCWRLAPRKDATGQQMTLRMSFKRSGEILGEPRITYYEGVPGSAASKEFTDSVGAAFRACIPLPFTNSFGAAVAGRPFTFRFIDDRRV
jgi:hypothetical protein